MSDLLPFIVIGITTGAVYGLAGTGLVLTYKTSGIFNFAYGSIAALSVFVFYWAHVEHGLAWPLAALLCLAVMSPIEGLLLELLARTLEPAGATLKVVVTVGLLLMVLGIGTLWFGDNLSNFPSFLPTATVRMVGVNVSYEQIIVVIVSVVAAALLYWFFRFVRLGIAMRGVVDNPALVSMTGENPVRVRRWAWVIGTVFASASGLLLAPSLSLNALVITMLVVQAFGAAAIGYFSSLPLTFVGGLLIGILGAVTTKYVVSVAWLSGLPNGLPFIILFVVLVVTPRARLAERRVLQPLIVRRSWQGPLRLRLAAGAAVLIVLAFLPELAASDLSIWSNFLVDVILFLSLGLLVRKSGQISLCHLAFAAIGAAAFGHFMDDWHLPWLIALLLAGLVAVPVGAVLAIPAIRLSGVFLALATFGFGILLEQMIYTTGLMFGPTTNGIAAPRPQVSLAGWHLYTDTGYYFVLLIFTVVTVLLIVALERGRMGRLLAGLADSPVALETHGTGTYVTRVLVFCIAAALASTAGALTSSLFHFAVGDNFSSFTSLTLVALVVITVGGDPWYGILAAVGYTVIPGYVDVKNINTYLEIFFGVVAVSFAVVGGRSPVVPRQLRRVLDRIGGRAPEEQVAGRSDVVAPGGVPAQARRRSAPATYGPADARSGLAVIDLSVRFGGIHAVEHFTFEAPAARITGLVGPNGAGKTTTFNACSGLVRPSSGRILLNGEDITSLGAPKRARMGLGRTFQRAELFNSLTVRENLELGREAAMAGSNPIRQLVSGRQDRRVVSEAVDRAVALTGIGALVPIQAGLLSSGQRRLVELARALAAPFDLLLLDEPSSGLDVEESHHFGEILSAVVADRATSVLLVEHDMALVQQVCEYIYVLDFGSLIFEGSPEAMLGSDVVRAAYLGGDASPPVPNGNVESWPSAL